MRRQHRISTQGLLATCAAKLREYESLRWAVRIVHAQLEPLPSKARLLAPLLRQRHFTSTVLFYPANPRADHVIYKALHVLGCRITNDLSAKFSLAVHWEQTTFRERKAILDEVASHIPVLNRTCDDISKRTVAATFASVFGYSLEVDPTDYVGKAVRKSNLNFSKDGKIVDCPISGADRSVVYQRFVDTEWKPGLVEDIRLGVLGQSFPLCWLKQRTFDMMFLNKLHSAQLVNPIDVFSDDELSRICIFAERIGMDYGELDILRDRNDRRIYIVDANSTPSGPPSVLSRSEYWTSILQLADQLSEIIGTGRIVGSRS